MGEHGAERANRGIEELLEELGVRLSRKRKASRPFSTTLFALGAEFDLAADIPKILPPIDKTEKFGILMQTFAGMFEFISRFSARGVLPANEAYVCMREPTRFRKERCPVSERCCKRGVALLANPFYWHFEPRGLSSDARGASKKKIGGWGVCAAGVCARGTWKPLVWSALKNEMISINPFKLLTAAAVIEVGVEGKVLRTGTRAIWRNDNVSAIFDLNRQRAGSSPMLEALRIVDEVASKYSIELYGRHIDGFRNTIADLLSRGQPTLALDIAAKEFGSSRMESIWNRMDLWAARIVRAARRH